MHTTEELSDLLESEELSDQKRRTIELLIEAMNDWPEDVIFLEEFLEAVEKRTGGVIHLSNTEKVLKKITLPNEAWIGESLTSIKVHYGIINSASIKFVDQQEIGVPSEGLLHCQAIDG